MKEKYLEDLKEIKDIMNRSTRFISLSGLSGVSTGVTALAGAYIAYKIIFENQDYLVYNVVNLNTDDLIQLFIIAMGTLFVSIVGAVFFTSIKTKKQNLNIWDQQTKRLISSLLIPLVTGGLVCLLLLFNGLIGISLPLTLVFYGLALVNASKYTLSEIKSLGIIEIFIGLLSFLFINNSLLFWALGFGLVQMVYGIVIQMQYK